MFTIIYRSSLAVFFPLSLFLHTRSLTTKYYLISVVQKFVFVMLLQRSKQVIFSKTKTFHASNLLFTKNGMNISIYLSVLIKVSMLVFTQLITNGRMNMKMCWKLLEYCDSYWLHSSTSILLGGEIQNILLHFYLRFTDMNDQQLEKYHFPFQIDINV